MGEAVGWSLGSVALMTNVCQFTGDCSVRNCLFWSSGSWSLSSSISPETVRLRSLRVLQKQVARPQEAVGQRLRIILSREKAIESGWLGWPGSLGWAARWLYEAGKKNRLIFLARIYQSHIPAVDRERRWALE